jgi:ABC-type molybdate transport system substrate-binding protein
VAFPDPETEGIGRLALEAIRAAGGQQLRDDVFVRNRERGFVRLTSIHHRQGIAWLADGATDVAVVWQTEARHHVRAGRPVQEVSLPPEHNVVGGYAAAVVDGAPHRDLAEAFVAHLAGPEGATVFRRHGFSSPAGAR